MLIIQGFTEQPSGQELNIVTSAILLIVQGFTEQPSGQELNIVTSAIILIVQGFISEALKEFGRYNYLAMLDKYSSNCILMTPAKVLIKLIMPGLGLGRMERF